MKVIKWIWCLHCERCFEAHLSREPQANEGLLDLVPDLEKQLGVERDRQIYAECTYEDCDGSPLDFSWWDARREGQPTLPEVPVEGQVYPLDSAMRLDVWREIEERVGELRANYLDAAIKVEAILESVVASLISPISKSDIYRPLIERDRNSIVRTAVLRHRNVTFNVKLDFLRSLGKLLGERAPAGAAKEVTKVMERRNWLAHSDWELVADSETDFELVRVEPDGRRKRTLVTPAIVDDWLSHAGRTESTLWDLYADLNPWVGEPQE